MRVVVFSRDVYNKTSSLDLSLFGGSEKVDTLVFNVEHLKNIRAGTVDSISVVQKENLHESSIADILEIISKGASISLRVPNAEALSVKLVLSGLVIVSKEEGAVIAKKPDYSLESVKLGNKDPKKLWKLMANDLEKDFDMEDEDDLLDEEKVAIETEEEIETPQKKKACKNCSCGLKEMLDEENGKASVEVDASGCGNCAKGDAFRCGGCPYLGLPKFTPGTKPEIKVLDDGSKVLLDVGSEFD